MNGEYLLNVNTVPANTDNLMNRTQPITAIVLHYTVQDFKNVYRNFQNNIKNDKAAASYLINTNGDIYKFAEDNKIVRHAGVSFWNRRHNVNQYSVGIELINFGHSETDLGGGTKVKGSDEFWYSFSREQINSTIKLVESLITKYNIKPYNIVGHADIAVPSGRKEDPGIFFPWEALARNGWGFWHNTNCKCKINLNLKKTSGNLLKTKKHFVKKLVDFGYPSPDFMPDLNNPPYGIKIVDDKKQIAHNTGNLIRNYNMHYRQEKGISTKIDAQDFEIMDSLLCMKKE